MLLDKPLVEMTITSCRRLACFIRTMDSFYENMADAHFLCRITCIDDHSSIEDRTEMQKKYPKIEFIWAKQKGHPYALRELFSRLKSEFVLHWEDDFILLFKHDYIARCMAIINRHENVSSVILTPNDGERHTDEYGDYIIKMYDPRVAKACPTTKCGFNRIFGQPKNPGFSLNPGLHKVAAIQSILWPTCDHHESNFGFQYQAAGHRVAYLDKFYIEHIGKTSSYILNNTKR